MQLSPCPGRGSRTPSCPHTCQGRASRARWDLLHKEGSSESLWAGPGLLPLAVSRAAWVLAAALGIRCFEGQVLPSGRGAGGCLFQATTSPLLGSRGALSCAATGAGEEPRRPPASSSLPHAHLVLAFVMPRNPGVFLSYPV